MATNTTAKRSARPARTTRQTPSRRAARKAESARRRLLLGAAAALLVAASAVWALWPDPQRTVHVALVDQTGFTTSSENDREAADRFSAVIADAASRRGRMFVVPIGADAAAAAVIADFDFDPDCPNPRICEERLHDLADTAAVTVEALIADDTGTDRTDVVSAVRTAASLCRQHPGYACEVHVVSDGVHNTDSLSWIDNVPADAAEIAREHLASGVALDMTGIGVDWTAIGTDAASSERAAQLTEFWETYLGTIGVADLLIARSIAT